MMRSFLARLVNSVTPALLVPGLLICLACATSFPVGELQEGMTMEAVRSKFGEPVATNSIWDPPGAPGGWTFLRGTWTYDAESSLTYVDEERDWRPEQDRESKVN